MAERTPRILIGLASDIHMRNFVETRALEELGRRFDVCWFAPESARQSLPALPGFTDVGRFHVDPRREEIRFHMRWIAIFAGHRRCRTLAVKRRFAVTSRRQRWPYALMSLPGLWGTANWLVETWVGGNPSVTRIVDAVRPDAIVFPSQGNDSLSLDLLRLAKARRIPTVMLNYNWDNMTTKGPMRLTPDRLCVWGEDMAQFARQVHRLKPEQVQVIGAAHFEQYIGPSRMDRPPADTGEPRLLFAGNSRGHAEAKYLALLEQAIESGRLPKLKIIFRPHPWRAPRPEEKDFHEYGFRHIELDAQLSGHFGRGMNAAKARPDYTFAPSMDYNARLLRTVNGVITPFSTLALEAALTGVPVLGLNLFEEVWLAQALSQFEHLQRFQRSPGVLVCGEESRLIDDVARLLALSRDPTVGARMREAVRPIVYSDDGRTTYAERLADVVGELIGAPSAAQAPGRLQGAPMLAERI